jgi:Ca2+-binding EF-hand superfamily protein
MMKMEMTLRKLYSVFDIDKNGILDVNEVAACLVVLCKGSLASKISFGLKIFSTVDTPQEVKIKYSELREFMFFIFRLSLETQSEILLDYDLETMAGEVVASAFKYWDIDENGEILLAQLTKFLDLPPAENMRR